MEVGGVVKEVMVEGNTLKNGAQPDVFYYLLLKGIMTGEHGKSV